MRLINADKYLERLQSDIDSEVDIIAKYIKSDTPIGTVKDGGRIGRLQGVQWCKNVLELDFYTVKAIPLERLKEVKEKMLQTSHADADGWNTVIDLDDVLSILDNLMENYEEKCTWIKYDHRTMCPKGHMGVDNPYWRIPENRMKVLKYCPYCGKEIEMRE